MSQAPVDFSQFVTKGKTPAKQKSIVIPAANRWWLADTKMLPAAIMSQVNNIIKVDRARIDGYNTYGKLYGTFSPNYWNGGYQLSSGSKSSSVIRDRLTYNIVQSCIDSTTAKIIKNKPKPMFLTSAGDSKVQRRAKKLDAYMYGLFYENNVYTKSPIAFRDACVYGEGIVHAYAEDGRVKYERVFPNEILTDYLESHYGPDTTLSLHRIKNLDRSVLINLAPDKESAISQMSNTQAGQISVADTVTVIESWRLPTGATSGRHCITSADEVLVDEDYHEDHFPFAIMRFNPRLNGFYAQGMAEQLVPTQIEINRTLISIQRSLYLGGTHKIFLKNGSQVIKSHFDNMVGTIISYAGDTPPQYVVPQLVQPEIYSHLQSMKSDGYQLVGVSQMQASGLKTPGVNSGRAMRTEQNINTERFESLDQMYQQFFVDLCKISIPVQRQIAESGDNTEIKVPGKRFIEKIKWSEVSLDDDDFVMQIYPVSKLPNDPEGRLSTIQEMAEAGWIDAPTARRLMDFPDLDAEENLANAQRDYLGKILDQIVEKGIQTLPEPDDNLQMAKKLVMEYISAGKLNELDEERIEMLRTFSSEIDRLLTPPPQAMPAPGMAPQGAQAPAQPMPAPQSDLIPNVNGAQ